MGSEHNYKELNVPIMVMHERVADSWASANLVSLVTKRMKETETAMAAAKTAKQEPKREDMMTDELGLSNEL